jgi:hypothetical protein
VNRPERGIADSVEAGIDLPATVSEVIARLRALEAAAAPGDGVACFARLYRQVTEEVDRKLAGETFANPRFLERLDVLFAGLFLSAVAEDARDPGSAPRAWAPLFAARARRRIAPLQFALAGMNAHINRDLAVALVSTCDELGVNLAERSPEHADFERVNLLLREVETRVKPAYVTGPLRILDRLAHRFGRLDDVVAMWDVERARAAAWANAQALWALRDEPALGERFVAALDRMVGLASRALLVSADSLLQRLVRRLRGASRPRL